LGTLQNSQAIRIKLFYIQVTMTVDQGQRQITCFYLQHAAITLRIF